MTTWCLSNTRGAWSPDGSWHLSESSWQEWLGPEVTATISCMDRSGPGFSCGRTWLLPMLVLNGLLVSPLMAPSWQSALSFASPLPSLVTELEDMEWWNYAQLATTQEMKDSLPSITRQGRTKERKGNGSFVLRVMGESPLAYLMLQGVLI